MCFLLLLTVMIFYIDTLILNECFQTIPLVQDINYYYPNFTTD